MPLEVAEGPGTLGMGLAVRNHLSIEAGHLLHEIVVMQQDGSIRPHGERVFVAGHGNPGIGGGDFAVILLFHGNPSLVINAFTTVPAFMLP